MQETKNLHLKKPEHINVADIADINDNMDIIDAEFAKTIPISKGGTGATTSADARSNLGLDDAATYGVTDTIIDDDGCLPNSKAVYTALNDKSDEGHTHNTNDIAGGILPISRGGTGAATVIDARKALGIESLNLNYFSVCTAVPIYNDSDRLIEVEIENLYLQAGVSIRIYFNTTDVGSGSEIIYLKINDTTPKVIGNTGMFVNNNIYEFIYTGNKWVQM